MLNIFTDASSGIDTESSGTGCARVILQSCPGGIASTLIVCRGMQRGCRSTLTMADAVTKLLIEEGLITEAEFTKKLLEERAVYQRTLKPTTQ